MTIEVGLSVQTEAGETYLIKKDPHGYPDLVSLSGDKPLKGMAEKKAMGKALYARLTGKPYPHPDATTRQVLWDFLEVAIQRLP